MEDSEAREKEFPIPKYYEIVPYNESVIIRVYVNFASSFDVVLKACIRNDRIIIKTDTFFLTFRLNFKC